jgi:hypothetical protein
MAKHDDRVRDYARELLSTLWGVPNKEPTDAFLIALKRVLLRHEDWLLACMPEFIAPDPPPIRTPITAETPVVLEDDVSTLQRWIDEGEWLH